MEAVLKYPGAKNRLAPWILSFIPEHKVYLEPFAGSLAVLLNKKRSHIETVNDLDGEIVDCEGINDEGRGYVYIFGYHVRLEPGERTTTLFDKVQNKKYGSKTIAANEKELIRIEPYAIQADDILESGITIDTTGEISATDLSYIYQTFFNQNVDTLH